MHKDLTDIYAGHDAGHYALPPELLASRATAQGLAEQRRAATAARAAADDTAKRARRAAAARLLELAARGRDLPAHPGASTVEARAAYELADADLLALGDALSAAERAMTATVGDAADEVITAALQPALAEVVAEVKALAPELAGLDLTDTAAVMRSPATVKAYQRLMAASRREAAIRAAQLGVHRAAGGTGRLSPRALVRNVGRVPIRRDLEGPARLLDLVARGAELWAPTAAELARAEQVAADRGEVIEVPGSSLTLRRARPVFAADAAGAKA